MKIYEDLRAAQVRLGVFQSVVVGLFALLLIQFWTLQVVRGRYFRTLAENNRTRSVPLAAPRGALLDHEELAAALDDSCDSDVDAACHRPTIFEAAVLRVRFHRRSRAIRTC